MYGTSEEVPFTAAEKRDAIGHLETRIKTLKEQVKLENETIHPKMRGSDSKIAPTSNNEPMLWSNCGLDNDHCTALSTNLVSFMADTVHVGENQGISRAAGEAWGKLPGFGVCKC